MGVVSPITGGATKGWTKPPVTRKPENDPVIAHMLDALVQLRLDVARLNDSSQIKHLESEIEELREAVKDKEQLEERCTAMAMERHELDEELAELRAAGQAQPDNNAELAALQERLAAATHRAERAENLAQESVRRIREEYNASLKAKGKVKLAAKPPAAVESEVHKDATGLLTSLVLRAKGYKDIRVQVRRGPDDVVSNLTLT